MSPVVPLAMRFFNPNFMKIYSKKKKVLIIPFSFPSVDYILLKVLGCSFSQHLQHSLVQVQNNAYLYHSSSKNNARQSKYRIPKDFTFQEDKEWTSLYIFLVQSVLFLRRSKVISPKLFFLFPSILVSHECSFLVSHTFRSLLAYHFPTYIWLHIH